MLELQTELNATAEQILFALRAGRFSHYRVPLKGAMLRLLRRAWKESYDNTGSFATPRWAPLSPRTIREKIRLGFGRKPIMRRTDRLYRSLTLQAKTRDGIVRVSETTLEVGTAVPYAAFHQRGGRILPRRQVLPDPAPKTLAEGARKILRDWIVEGRGG